MKVVVIKAFIDKNTGEPYNAGDIFESTNKDRIKELQDGEYLAAGALEKTPKKDKEPKEQDSKDNQNTGEPAN